MCIKCSTGEYKPAGKVIRPEERDEYMDCECSWDDGLTQLLLSKIGGNDYVPSYTKHSSGTTEGVRKNHMFHNEQLALVRSVLLALTGHSVESLLVPDEGRRLHTLMWAVLSFQRDFPVSEEVKKEGIRFVLNLLKDIEAKSSSRGWANSGFYNSMKSLVESLVEVSPKS